MFCEAALGIFCKAWSLRVGYSLPIKQFGGPIRVSLLVCIEITHGDSILVDIPLGHEEVGECIR